MVAMNNVVKATHIENGLIDWVKKVHEPNPNPALSDEDMIRTANCFIATTLRSIQSGLQLTTSFPEDFATAMKVGESCRPLADHFREDFQYTYRADPKKNDLLEFVVQAALEINGLYLDSATKPALTMQRTTAFDTWIERLSWLLGLSRDKILAFMV